MAESENCIVYILMQCKLGSEEDVIYAISAMPHVTEVRGTYGIYDIFCKMVAPPKMVGISITKIRSIPGVESTTTLRPVMEQGGR